MGNYPAVRCRLITRVGTRFQQWVFWGDEPGDPSDHEHHAYDGNWPTYGIDRDWIPEGCDKCGVRPYGEFKRSAGSRPVWDTPSGEAGPGDMYWQDDYREGPGAPFKCFHWDNCTGRHLRVVLANMHHWDVDSRASNCALPKERTHRCWVREGEPPNVTAGKAGHTCSAGAGSIAAGDYHGFLKIGTLTAG